MEKSLPVRYQTEEIPHGQKLRAHKERLLPQKRKIAPQGDLTSQMSSVSTKMIFAEKGRLGIEKKSQEKNGAQDKGKKSSEELKNNPVSGDLSTHFLSTYFREMGQLSILNAEQELAMAKNLASLETELWEKILTFSPISPALTVLFKKHFSSRLSDLIGWEQTTRVFHSNSGSKSKNASKFKPLAQKLQERDIDRLWITEALSELRTWEFRFPEARLDWEEEISTIERLRHQVEQTKNAFVQANLRLVVSLARRFYQGRMSLPDLIQEGNIGLIKAVERFDYRRGYRFSTYASWWIRHTISRALADKGRSVRVPVHMIDTYYRLLRSRTELINKLGRQPSSEELSKETGVSTERIEKMNGYLLEHSFSIDQSIGDDDRRQFVDMIEDESKENQPMTQLIDRTINHEVEELFAALNPIEADVLRQRFGLGSDTEEERTLKEIGKKYRLSRERIRQIQEQALAKIRQALVKKELI